MSLIRNEFGSVNNQSRTITHSLRKSACCKLLSVLQLKTLLTIKPSMLLILGLNISLFQRRSDVEARGSSCHCVSEEATI